MLEKYQSYAVWDVTIRLFHWINVIAVMGLMAVGVVLLNDDALGISRDGKILLKHVHVLIGYGMVANLAWRLVWGFFGSRHARWGAVLPFGRGYGAQLKAYLASLRQGAPQHYLGHNPLGRLAVLVLLLLLVTMAATGLVLAGTDLFYPPFGGAISRWVVASGVDPATLLPYTPAMVDPVAFQEMKSFRRPFGITHVTTFYALAAMVVLHVIAVIVTEICEGGGLVSAMFSGKKVLPAPPVDGD